VNFTIKTAVRQASGAEAACETNVTLRSVALSDVSASCEMPVSVMTSSISEIAESVQKPGAVNFELQIVGGDCQRKVAFGSGAHCLHDR